MIKKLRKCLTRIRWNRFPNDYVIFALELKRSRGLNGTLPFKKEISLDLQKKFITKKTYDYINDLIKRGII